METTTAIAPTSARQADRPAGRSGAKVAAGRASGLSRDARLRVQVVEAHAVARRAGIETVEGRDWWIVNVGLRRWSGGVVGRVFGLSRQRVFQIVREAREGAV